MIQPKRFFLLRRTTLAREWLDGDGASAARLVSVTEPLWSVGATACAEVAAELDALGSPEGTAGGVVSDSRPRDQ